MIFNPDFFIDEFAQARTDSFGALGGKQRSVAHRATHQDVGKNSRRRYQPGELRGCTRRNSAGCRPGPGHDRGFGHQRFLLTTLPKITRAREMIDRVKPGCGLEVDGGIDATTASLAVAAGADVLVPDRRFSTTAKASRPRCSGCSPVQR
jgi:hypothetical protein